MSRDHLGQNVWSSNLGFDRGVLLLDDCEGNSDWAGSGTGSDFAVAFDVNAAWAGLKGLQLDTKSTTPAADDQVRAFRVVEHPETGLLVMRARLGFPDVSDVKFADMSLNLDDSNDNWLGLLRWDRTDDTARYQNDAGTFTDLGVVVGFGVDNLWSMFEIVLDMNKKEWISAQILGQKVDLAGVPLDFQEGGGTSVLVNVEFWVTAIGTNRTTMYVDQVYVGQYLDL